MSRLSLPPPPAPLPRNDEARIRQVEREFGDWLVAYNWSEQDWVKDLDFLEKCLRKLPPRYHRFYKFNMATCTNLVELVSFHDQLWAAIQGVELGPAEAVVNSILVVIINRVGKIVKLLIKRDPVLGLKP